MGQSQSSKNDRGRDYRIWIYGGGGLESLILYYSNSSEEMIFCLEWRGGAIKRSLATICTLQHLISVHVEKCYDMLRSKATHMTLGELDYNLIVLFHGILIL